MNDLAEKGKRLAGIICVGLVGIAVISTITYNLQGTSDKLFKNILSLFLIIILCLCLYRGQSWARWMFAIVLGIAGAVTFLGTATSISAVGLNSYTIIMLILGLIYLTCSGTLIFSKSISAYIEYCKENS